MIRQLGLKPPDATHIATALVSPGIVEMHTFDGRLLDLDGLLDKARYKAKYGVDNPNLKPLAKMRATGVEIYVCGEQLMGDGIDFKWLTPDVTVANDGLLALTVFQNQGYAVLAF